MQRLIAILTAASVSFGAITTHAHSRAATCITNDEVRIAKAKDAATADYAVAMYAYKVYQDISVDEEMRLRNLDEANYRLHDMWRSMEKAPDCILIHEFGDPKTVFQILLTWKSRYDRK